MWKKAYYIFIAVFCGILQELIEDFRELFLLYVVFQLFCFVAVIVIEGDFEEGATTKAFLKWSI